MPNLRCKWYRTDGTPIRDGCPTPGCRFVHPEQQAWKSLRPYKSLAPCIHFDPHGKPINGGCRSSSRDCKFIHPDDPAWGVIENSRARVERKANSSVASVSRSAQPDSEQHSMVSKDSRTVPPPGALKAGRGLVDQRTPTLSDSLVVTHKSKDTSSTVTDVGTEIKHASRPAVSPTSLSSSGRSPMDPQRSSAVSRPTTALSRTIDEDALRQSWRRRISLLSQARDIIQKLSEIDADLRRRTALQSTGIIPVMASSVEVNLEALRDSARKEQDMLKEKMDMVVTQLIEEDIWPLPTTTQSDFSVERRQLELSASIAELGRRLDVMVTRLNEIREMGKQHQASTSVVAGGEEQSMSRSSKRRRISVNGSFQTPFNLPDILARLDTLQSKAIEMEAELLHDDQLLGVVDERIEGWLLKPVVRPVLPDSLNDDVRNLDVDLDVLCGELVNLDTSDLASHIGTLRLEIGSWKQTMESLASDQQSLQQRQADIDYQAHKIMEELKELRSMPQDKPEVVAEKLVGEVTLEVQKHIDSEKVQIFDTIKSFHEEIKNTVFAALGPMVIKTEMMYNSLRQTNAS